MASSSSNGGRNPVEHDPTERYIRYDTIIREDGTQKVYKGCDREYGREVAWSKTGLTEEISGNEELIECLHAEAQQLRQLRHKNVVRYLDSWIRNDEEEKVINMITEFLPSGNLEEYIISNNHVRLNAIKYWCIQILKGLEYLHSENIIHGNLRCDKIFVDGNSGRIKIGELGLTVIEEPESWQDQGRCNKVTDIYSFGICVAEMVAISEVEHTEVMQFCRRCLRPAPIRPTASELLQDLFLRLSEQPRIVQEQVQPRTFRLKGIKFGESGLIRMCLYLDNGRVGFDYSVENDTTEEVMKRIEAEECLSSMSAEEFTVVSELIEILITALKSSDLPQFKGLQITSKGRIILPANRVCAMRLTEAGIRRRRRLRLKGLKLGSCPFIMTLYSDDGSVHLKFAVEDDTTEEVMKKIVTEEGLSDLSIAEFTLISELLELLTTELKSPESPEIDVLEITSEKCIVRPSSRKIDNVQQPEAMQPEVVDNVQQSEAMQQPEVTDSMQQPEVTNTMQQPEVKDAY